MKTYINTWRYSLRCAIIIPFLAFGLSTRGNLPINEEVQNQIATRPTVESKVNYLCSVIFEKGDESDAADVRKASAIMLLGEISSTNAIGTNAISVLVSNITFIDKRSHGSPASHALVIIGEPAVPELLKVLKDTPQNVMNGSFKEETRPILPPSRRQYPAIVAQGSPEDKVRWAVWTLSFIKKTKYEQFVDEQKGKMPDIAWERLKQYGVSIDIGR